MSTRTISSRFFELFLAALGFAACLVIVIRLMQVISLNQALWPLPGLYLVEMTALCAAAALALLISPNWGAGVCWGVGGALLGFAILGAFSIGFAFLPLAAIEALAGLLADLRLKGRLLLHLGLSVLCAVAQAVLILVVVQFSF
jgi:hypothetical protein